MLSEQTQLNTIADQPRPPQPNHHNPQDQLDQLNWIQSGKYINGKTVKELDIAKNTMAQKRLIMEIWHNYEQCSIDNWSENSTDTILYSHS